LAKYREQVRFGRFPDELREQAATYTQERRRAGAEPAAIAGELGVCETTVRAWVKEAARLPARAGSAPVAMMPLVVRPAPQTVAGVAGARLEVAFPDGTKLQVVGMAGRDLVDTIAALRGSR
jgi:predicted transcriptional regulator